MTKKSIRASEDTLGTLHEMVAQAMLNKLRSGEFTASDLSVIVKFLQVNNIVLEASSSEVKGAMAELRKLALPTFQDDPDEEYVN